jgi:hypothetical protein
MLSKVPEGMANLTSTFPKRQDLCFRKSGRHFAYQAKELLLIGMDIRNPRLDEYLN